MDYRIEIKVIASEDGVDEQIFSDSFPDTVRLEENLGKLERIIDDHESDNHKQDYDDVVDSRIQAELDN